MSEKKFRYVLPGGRLSGKTMDVHWEHAIPAYRNTPHVWNVGGQDNVAAYLMDTGEGLILIDTGLDTKTLYLLIDRIWRSGHDPKDIKEIFCTHWHGDHTCCVRLIHEMTGARVWMSKEDEVEHQKYKDDDKPMRVIPYTVDCFYDNSKPFVMGRFSINTLLCPGHTPGCTSFFFDDTDEKTGKTYKCALHGGLGVGLMSKEHMERLKLPFSMVETFIKQSQEIAKMPVDITLCSHLNQGNILPNIPEDVNDYTVFVADYLWSDMLKDRARATMDLYPEKYSQEERDALAPATGVAFPS